MTGPVPASREAATTEQSLVSVIQPAPEAAAFGTSPQIDKIASALVEAQGMMFSPARNKRVLYDKKRGGGTVDFRYATLDVINDMIRLPLHENGLLIMHVTQRTRAGHYILTRLMHRSGQWMETLTPLLQEEAGPQAYSSAQTLARRYGICSLLNIAAESDDDGNEAEGNRVRAMHPDMAERDLREKLSRLFHMANLAKFPLDVTNLLKAWQADLPDWMAFRLQADRADAWEKLTRLIPSAIRRVHGDAMSTAWSAAVLAESREDLARLRANWDGSWKAARLEMKLAAIDGYGLLWEHLRLQCARVERELEEVARRPVAVAGPPVAEALPAPVVTLEGEPSPWEAAPPALPLLPTPEGEPITPLAERSPAVAGFFVIDEDGEPASDATTSPLQFATLYAGQHHGSSDKQALAMHNARGLDWACGDPPAALLLTNEVGFWVVDGCEGPSALDAGPQPDTAAMPPPPAALPAVAEPVDVELPLPPPPPPPRRSPLLVPMPKTHRGTPDLGRYLLAVKLALRQIDDGAVLLEWIDANTAAWDALPISTRLQVRALVVACERVLGLERAA